MIHNHVYNAHISIQAEDTDIYKLRNVEKCSVDPDNLDDMCLEKYATNFTNSISKTEYNNIERCNKKYENFTTMKFKYRRGVMKLRKT